MGAVDWSHTPYTLLPNVDQRRCSRSHGSYEGRHTPYALMWVGVAPKALFEQARSEGKQFPYINHTPDFFVDLAAIPMGARINTTAVMNIMAKR